MRATCGTAPRCRHLRATRCASACGFRPGGVARRTGTPSEASLSCPDPTSCIFIRTGLAEEPGEAWPDDSSRPLTRRGEVALCAKSARPRAPRRVVRCRASRAAGPHRVRPRRLSLAASIQRPAHRQRRLALRRAVRTRRSSRLERSMRERRAFALVGHEPGRRRTAPRA